MKPDGWLGVELRHLAALQAVAREGSFGGAAVALGYSQSAVSQQIAALERIVGERLVERPGGPRPVSLTDAGKLLLGHAEGIVARLEAAQADLAAYSEGSAGTLRVGTYQSVGARVLPSVMLEFAAAWPLVSIQLTESTDDAELLSLVERGELDLSFVMLPVEDGPFDTRMLMGDPYVLLVRPDSPLAGTKNPPSLKEIAAVPLIGYRQCRSIHAVEERFRGTGLEPQIVFRSDDNTTIQGMVAAGVGSALVPRLTVETRDDSVLALPVDPRVPPREIGIAWHKERYHAPAARAFVGVADRVCKALEAELEGRPAPGRCSGQREEDGQTGDEEDEHRRGEDRPHVDGRGVVLLPLRPTLGHGESVAGSRFRNRVRGMTVSHGLRPTPGNLTRPFRRNAAAGNPVRRHRGLCRRRRSCVRPAFPGAPEPQLRGFRGRPDGP